MRPAHPVVVGLLAAVLAWTVPLAAEGENAADEKPLVAGSEGVPAPKKTKHVLPVYPADAQARGIRGIVILDLVIDARGRVVSTTVIRSVPGLDEAALAAARQWEYEPVKVGGKPVSVSLTIPITFTLALPRLARAGGIPELRQGAAPLYPAAARGDGTAAAEVTLDADGRVASARVIDGAEPWAKALVDALEGWRFSPPEEDAVVSFRVEAAFKAAAAPGAGTVALKASDLRRAELLTAAQPVPPAPAAPPQAPAPAAPQAPVAAPPQPADPPAPPLGAEPPPVEVITAPPPPPPVESGISIVRDVTLEPGVPELARGRRPVAPPLARMAGVTGAVEVTFSVGAAGTTLVQGVNGPELLKKAAEGTVGSWTFRRTRADRAYLLAVFTYAADKASAVVRPQPPPAQPAAASTPPPEPAAEPAAALPTPEAPGSRPQP